MNGLYINNVTHAAKTLIAGIFADYQEIIVSTKNK